MLPSWSTCDAIFQSGNEIVVNVISSKNELPSGKRQTFLHGYRATLSGQVLLYHSAHPDAEAALLVRARSDVRSIEWETDTLLTQPNQDYVTFIWLAGLERSGWGESRSGHKFDFYINGERRLTFRNFKDSTDRHWTVRGERGVELTFRAETVDKFGDLFGYMFLKVPADQFPTGKPLTLRVEGEDAKSPEWYMTFQYRFNFQPSVRSEPALFRGQGGETQVLRVSLDNLIGGRTVGITGLEGKVRRDSLNLGANIFLLPIEAVRSHQTRTLVFQVDGREVSRRQIDVEPVVPRTFFLLSHSHNDIGYTDLQPNVERRQWENIDQALDLIDATRGYPPEARYKWNIEVLWPLESYLKHATQERRQRLIHAIQEGSIGLNALYGNELTGLATAVEMSHFTDFARRFTKEFDIPITTAVVSDIPGFTWGIVPALAQSGVRYFASGPNSGDRIGYVLQEWGDKPFYWASQSGGEKVLFWVAGAGYSTFHQGTLAKLGDEIVMKLARRLDESRYPYEIVHMPYTQGDNGPPDSTLSDFVKQWNERFTTPRLIIATHKEMFEAFERRYGPGLPTRVGDFTPYWEDGALSTAHETAISRRAVDRLVSGEALWSMLSPASYPKQEYDEAWRNIVLWDEHTWGAGNSVSDPDDPGVTGQWKIKQEFARRADSLSRELLSRVLTPPIPTEMEPAIDVYNPTSWERSEVAIIPPEESRAGNAVVDEQGRRMASQRLNGNGLAFRVPKIAPLSGKRYFIEKGTTEVRGHVRVTRTTIQNQAIRLALDPATGAIRDLQWKNFRFGSSGRGLGAFLYVPGANPDSALSLRNVRLSVGDSGGLVGSIVIDADAPQCRSYRTTILLRDGEEMVDIVTTIDKLPVRSKEGIHVAFFFDVRDPQVRYDVANAIVRPELDQLAGSCKNFFSVQNWVDVSNEEYGITLGVPDAPLIEIGEITAEQPWKKITATSSTIYSYVMNNYWHTNYKADQEGEFTVCYSLRPHGKFSPLEAVRFGRECREALIVAKAVKKQKTIPSLFHIEPPEVLVSSVKPTAEGKDWLVQLYNPTSRDRDVMIWQKEKGDLKVTGSDAGGRSINGSKMSVRISAFGSAFLRVGRR